jgi:hypothetical protein
MKIFKQSIKTIVLIVTFSAIYTNVRAFLKTDSTKIREVHTSQQMVITEVSHAKGQKTVRFKARLVDVFRVSSIINHKTTIELDWAVCPTAGCPAMATYYGGTKSYQQIGAIIDNARRSQAKIKRLAALAKSRPRINETYTERL